jgi:hypothetical protein
MKRTTEDTVVIFRRFRKTKDGKVLDAFKYGLRAWPIRVPKNQKN